MTVVNAWVGAVTPSSARVVAKITGASAELFVADNPTMTGAVGQGVVAADADKIVALAAADLTADTHYWWQVSDTGVPDTSTTGRFRTHPQLGAFADFTFWAAGDAGLTPDVPGTGAVLASSRLSNHTVFDTIRTRALDENWLFGVHLGDLHYYDLGSDLHGIVGGATAANYRRAYDDVLLQPLQHQLYRDVPVQYLWDDHDYGPNDADRTHVGRAAAQQAYRQRVPHAPLVDAEAIYQSWQIGRILFIASDTRSYRDPNTTPQTSTKTLLGVTQKAWMRDLLENSGAAFLVWICPERAWHSEPVTSGSGADHWGNFPHERDELTAMFQSTGWADRMIVINADAHQMAMDTGATNAYGGFPVYQLSPLDAAPAGLTPDYLWDLGTPTTDRAQYGTIRIQDRGDDLIITATGWIGTNQQIQHQWSLVLVEPEPPPAPEIPLPTGTVSSHVVWLGCDLATGTIIAELPDLHTGSISRLLGGYTSARLRLPIPLGGPGALGDRALQATEPGRTMVVAVVNDQPAWAGLVYDRLGGTGAELDLATATLESYFTHRYVADHEFVQIDEARILADLVKDAGVMQAVGPGIGLTIDAPPTGTLRDRTYVGTDNAIVYERMQELMSVQGGPEWTIELFWEDDAQTAVAKVVRVRKRIGVAASAPLAVFETTAPSVFSSQGVSEAHYRYNERRGGSLGANVVVAYSSGEGDDQPRSAPAIDADQLAAGYPIYERRFQPSTDITSTAVLDSHARRDLELRRNGQRTWEIAARWNTYPRLNIDWRIGDDIAWDLAGHRHPAGVQGQGRCVGWSLDPGKGTVVPILLDPMSDGGDA